MVGEREVQGGGEGLLDARRSSTARGVNLLPMEQREGKISYWQEEGKLC